MTYLELQENMAEINENTQLIPLKDFFKRENIISFEIKSFREINGKTIELVEIPLGIRLKELTVGGGMLSQPWFRKDDTSRVFIHKEMYDWANESKENQELFDQMVEHEIGHLVSMSNNFSTEFDSITNNDEIDEREIYNIRKWIFGNNIQDVKFLGSTLGKTIDYIIDGLKGVDIFGHYALQYISFREHCANFYLANTIKNKNWKPVLFEELFQNAAALGILVSKGIETLGESGLLNEGLNLVKTATGEELDELKAMIVEERTPLFNQYFEWCK